MTKHSRHERDQRKQETERIREIESAWFGSLTPAARAEFTSAVEAARARGPLPPPPNMAPGTAPNPPRPGHEPRPPKNDEARGRRRY